MPASDTLGLRGPGRFAGGFAATGVVDGVPTVDGVDVEVSGWVPDIDATGGVRSGSRHKGHFFASGESAATSTTSLAQK